MTTDDGDAALTRPIRFRIAVQRNRAVMFMLACGVAVVFEVVGLIHAGLLTLFGVLLLALISAIGLWWLHATGWTRRRGWTLDWIWILTDMALITWAVAITGGIESPWYPWYLANISGTAFVVGQRAAFLTYLGDTLCYVGVLWLVGDLTGFGAELYFPVGVITSMYAASFFFLRATTELQRRRRQVEEMRDEQSVKVQELTRLTEALEQRGDELSEANLRISESDRLKSQFLANMSHELRTPLNSIIGFSEILQSRLQSELSDKHLRFLENIHGAGQRLLGIINDILDLSKVEAGTVELNPEKVPVRAVLDGVCTVLKGTASHRSISFDVDVADEVSTLEGDPVKVKQILYNLATNAVKFSYDDATIQLSARFEAADVSPLGVDTVVLAVSDDGIGIDPKDQELIFEEFRQADGTAARKYQGTGLGLALVKRFVELHEGRVDVDSAVGLGSTFSVRLPVSFQGRLEPDGEQTSDDALAPVGSRILVVEDDPTAWERIQHDLSSAAFLPVRARSRAEAVDMARRLRPTAITLDLVIPGGDGWEVLRQLKADPATREIPVIIVSMLDNRELGLALGADDYFVKPVDGSRLVTRLTEQLVPSLPRGEERSLLLVDDDPQVHELLGDALGDAGFALLHAHTGQHGIDMALESLPDLIVLDLMMEEMDGFDVAATLRSDDRTAAIPIVVFTAKDMTRDDRHRLRGKVEALVQKGDQPPSGLAPIIRELVERHHREGTGVRR